ncbi:MAG TPA: hypothetical protein VK145_00745, partial [Candidatus Nanoarchaeia archaeon]|nr:hypothetical protein [Candidatus Nanoarchaeia archaeon]
EDRKVFSIIGACFVVIVAIIIALWLFSLSLGRTALSLGGGAQPAQVSNSIYSSSVEQVTFKSYRAPANLTVY